MSRRRRLRTLDPEERALWQHVARSVQPLRPRDAILVEAAPAAAETVADDPAPGSPAPRPRAAPRPAPPPLAALEPRVRRSLSRGAEVDARLDLHGLTQAAAHRRLHLFVVEAQALGHSVILVITGKGDGAMRLVGLSERGILRRTVPLWLADPSLRPYVVGFETASRRHGGDGALYVRIRRRRGAEDRG
ncbi:Smr/MutS family protein [Aquabacter spiritensis]|uniref:DNA-nicking Smr family endonuclease n=1 Tax=Aquabacter spiritensis TaxID=933073 RepID=A0A4R3M0I9_9HYPH|nr:Smr/MutS family protein [Aquabacter spiritensis]TCT06584.1 DNA-nicking Smr family endonuclease [Aquabacter spiritensis]